MHLYKINDKLCPFKFCQIIFSSFQWILLKTNQSLFIQWRNSLVNINTNLFEKDYFCICKKIRKYSWICKTRMVNSLLKKFPETFSWTWNSSKTLELSLVLNKTFLIVNFLFGIFVHGYRSKSKSHEALYQN